MSREAIQMALEALELLARYENPSTKIQVRKPKDGGSIVTMYPHKVATEAAAALREMLAQPEQEPVLWLKTWSDGSVSVLKTKWHIFADHELEPLYTTPLKREWVGLTAYEIQEIHSGNQHWGNFACAIEAKLKEKNT